MYVSTLPCEPIKSSIPTDSDFVTANRSLSSPYIGEPTVKLEKTRCRRELRKLDCGLRTHSVHQDFANPIV